MKKPIYLMPLVIIGAAVNFGCESILYADPAEEKPGTSEVAEENSQESDLLTYRNEAYNFEFDYPAKLELQQRQNGEIWLIHSIAYVHSDLCDLTGDAEDLDRVVDFSATFQLAPDFYNAIRLSQGPNFVNIFFEGDAHTEVELQEGYIDRLEIGGREGYRVAIGAGGCGRHTYYFPNLNADGMTMIIRKSILPDLSPINSNYEEIRALPNVISPEEELEILENIVRSFRL